MTAYQSFFKSKMRSSFALGRGQNISMSGFAHSDREFQISKLFYVSKETN